MDDEKVDKPVSGIFVVGRLQRAVENSQVPGLPTIAERFEIGAGIDFPQTPETLVGHVPGWLRVLGVAEHPARELSSLVVVFEGSDVAPAARRVVTIFSRIGARKNRRLRFGPRLEGQAPDVLVVRGPRLEGRQQARLLSAEDVFSPASRLIAPLRLWAGIMEVKD